MCCFILKILFSGFLRLSIGGNIVIDDVYFVLGGCYFGKFCFLCWYIMKFFLLVVFRFLVD